MARVSKPSRKFRGKGGDVYWTSMLRYVLRRPTSSPVKLAPRVSAKLKVLL